MEGVILNELSSGYFTNMKSVFNDMGNIQKEYNWLITDFECNHYPSNDIQSNDEYIFMEGNLLSEILDKYDIQFIWGVFSGFKKNITLENILKEPLPFADGNRELWNAQVKIQHYLADIEIISWDSSLLLLKTKQKQLLDNFIKHNPKSKDLREYNLR